MGLEEVFGVCVLVALGAFCAGWSMGDTAGYTEGYRQGMGDREASRRMGLEKEDEDG